MDRLVDLETTRNRDGLAKLASNRRWNAWDMEQAYCATWVAMPS
ncbi:hypothetical protein [Streptomyces sp. NPDC047928]